MRFFVAVALLLCAVGCASNPKPHSVPTQPKHDALSISETPAQSFEPAYVRVRIHVDKAPENRLLAWACDSGDGMRFSSEIQLDGENAQQTFVIDRKDVTGGEYECVAALARQGMQPIYAHTKFTVIPREF